MSKESLFAFLMLVFFIMSAALMGSIALVLHSQGYLQIEGLNNEYLISGGMAYAEVWLRSFDSIDLTRNNSEYWVIVSDYPGVYHGLGSTKIIGLHFSKGSRFISVHLDGVSRGQKMQIRLTRYDYCPDNDTLGGRRLLGISDLDKKVVTFEGRDGSWVIDMDRDEAAGAIMLWNTQIETGEIKSPVGSHYVTGPASRSIPGDVGIYFVDSTKI